MADLNDVYGVHYRDDTIVSKTNHILNMIINNFAHRQFNFRLFDSYDLWEQQKLSKTSIKTIINKVHLFNKMLHVSYIDKQSSKINMLPELVINSPVEYFMIIDAEFHRAYFIYITPYDVNAY